MFRRERSEDAPTHEHAACHVLAAPGHRVVIEGNQVDGWAHSMHCAPKDPAGEPATCIIGGNTVSGDISLVGPRPEAKTLLEDNLNIDTLGPATVVGAEEK